MEKLSALPNIGPVLEKQLAGVGIHDAGALCALGSRAAWLRILARDPSACVNRLYALEGAVRGVHRHRLDEATKKALCAFVRKAKGGEA